MKSAKGLPAYFKDVEARNLIDQHAGSAIDLRSLPDELSKKDRKLITRSVTECGRCVGAHLGIALEAEPSEVMDDRFVIRTGDGNMHNVNKRKLVIRDYWYIDGVYELFDRLGECAHFAQFLKSKGIVRKKNRIAYSDGMPCHRIDTLTDYLCQECGAPERCFGAMPWPEEILPSQVFEKVIELNPEIA